MMHFFKKPEIHLDCFTYRRDVIEYAPVVNGIEKIPEWWKALPKSFVHESSFYPTATMKGCVGMYNYYHKSVAMPMWSDLCINVPVKNQYQWQFSDGVSSADIHGEQQFTGLSVDGFSNIKIKSPWLFKTKLAVDWLLSCPMYSLQNQSNFIFPNGILDFKTQSTTHIQLFINTQQPGTFTIPFDTLFLFTPISDAKVTIHRHLVTMPEYVSMTELATQNTFLGKYRLHKRIQKCPYKDKTK